MSPKLAGVGVAWREAESVWWQGLHETDGDWIFVTQQIIFFSNITLTRFRPEPGFFTGGNINRLKYP
jgi:hypothetical protein